MVDIGGGAMTGIAVADPPGWAAPSRILKLNAVSFAFITSAVLFAAFLIVVVFGKIVGRRRPTPAGFDRHHSNALEAAADKPAELPHASSYSRAVAVLMPGENYPTFYARPIPKPLAADGVDWPSHAESSQQEVSAPSKPS